MPLLNKSQFAKKAGVTRPAIGYAVKKGNLRVNDDGMIDTNDPFSKEYLNQRMSSRQRKQGLKRKAGFYDEVVEADPFVDPSDGDGVDDVYSSAALTKRALEKQKLHEQTLVLQIKREQLRGTLIDIEAMREIFMKFYAVHTGELHPLGDKIAQDVAAAFDIEDETAAGKVREIIDGHIFKALAHMKRLMSDFTQQKMKVNGR